MVYCCASAYSCILKQYICKIQSRNPLKRYTRQSVIWVIFLPDFTCFKAQSVQLPTTIRRFSKNVNASTPAVTATFDLPSLLSAQPIYIQHPKCLRAYLHITLLRRHFFSTRNENEKILQLGLCVAHVYLNCRNESVPFQRSYLVRNELNFICMKTRGLR